MPTDKHNELHCQKINPQNQPTSKHGSHEKDDVNVEASSNQRAAIRQIPVRTSTHPAETLQLSLCINIIVDVWVNVLKEGLIVILYIVYAAD